MQVFDGEIQGICNGVASDFYRQSLGFKPGSLTASANGLGLVSPDEDSNMKFVFQFFQFFEAGQDPRECRIACGAIPKEFFFGAGEISIAFSDGNSLAIGKSK